MIFGTQNPEKIWHEMLDIYPPHLSGVATLPWEIQKSFSTVLFIQNSDYLCYISRTQTVIHLPTPPENVTTLTCELQNFFIWLKVSCVLSNAGGSEESQLWVVVGGSEKKWLWCVATGMSSKQCHSKCSALIHASSLFSTLISRTVHHALLKFSPCHNKPLPQASTCPYQYARFSCSVPQTQY